MANVLQWNSSTNSFSVSGASSVTQVVGEGIDNNFSVPQTFGAGILQTGAAGAGNQSPLLNVGDAFSDFIASGVQWAIPSSASLTTSMTSGSAYLNSVRTLVPAVSGYSFPASNDTYVSINNSGLIDYQSVANGATAPTPTSGYVQTSKVVTSPIQSPTATLSTSTSGSLASGTYGVALVAFDATGYGAVGASGTVAVTSAQSGSGSIEISWVNPLNETSMDIYATTAGSTTLGLVASGVTGTSYTYTGSVAPGAAAPTTATSNAVQNTQRLLGLFPYKEGQGFVTPEMFGATGLGFPFDDSGAINDALNYASSVGGAVVYCTKTYYCNSNVTVPANCSLRGIYGPRPSPSSSNQSNYSSEIIFNSDYGVIQDYSSHVGGLILFSLAAQQSPNGTAAFSNGNGAYSNGGQDCSLTDCGIFGFNNAAFYSNNPGRTTVDGIFFDCQNGITIDGAYDICEIRNCHGWPQLGDTSTLRPGTGFQIIGGGSSWHKVIDCFCLGYYLGFVNYNSGNNSFINCGCDGNFVGSAGAGVGFSMNGAFGGVVELKNFQCTSTQVINVNTTNATSGQLTLKVDGLQVWGPSGNGIFNITNSNLVSISGFIWGNSVRTDFGSIDSGSTIYVEGQAAASFSSQASPNVILTSAFNSSFYNGQNIYSGNTKYHIKLVDTTTGQPVPNKFIRSAEGQLEIVNSDFSAVIAYLTDTGSLVVWGNIISQGTIGSPLAVSSTTTSGSITATAAQLAGGYLADGATQTAAFTITTDTAANILAAMPDAVVGTSFKFRFINNDQSATGYAGTLAGGTGVTIGTVLPNPAVPKGGYEDYLFTFTAIGASPTLTVEAVGGNATALL